jgi:hypothetical protein
MALDFTQIKDEPGAAIFLVHDGTSQDEAAMKRLADDLRGRTSKQIILLSAQETTGRSVLEFYGLAQGRYVLIVRDNDELHQSWAAGDNFDPSQIAYSADQVG